MTPTIGQEAAVIEHGIYARNSSISLGWRVTKITATGQFTLTKGDRTQRFKPNGQPVGANDWNRTFIRWDVDAVRKEVRQLQQKRIAAAAVSAVQVECRETYHKEAMLTRIQQLEQLLAVAKQAVEAIED